MAARRGLVSNIGLTPFASTHHSVNWSKIEILYFSIIGHEALDHCSSQANDLMAQKLYQHFRNTICWCYSLMFPVYLPKGL